jgi:hypothetical protein
MHTTSLKLKQEKRSILKNARIQQRLNNSSSTIKYINPRIDIEVRNTIYYRLKHKTFF